MSISRSPIITRNRSLINLYQPVVSLEQSQQPIISLEQNQQPVMSLEQNQNSLPPPQIQHSNSSGLKLPPFYNKYPHQWFILAETQFRIKNITSEISKYEYLIVSLSQDMTATVFDIIQAINDNWNNSASTAYSTLKEALLERNSLSESQRLESLLADLDIGDRKPSEFYRTLKQTAGQSDSISDKLIIQLWIRKLPTQIQVSLKTLPNPDIKTLLNMANSIYEIILSSKQGHVHAISSSTSEQNDHLSRLEKQIQTLTDAIHKLSVQKNFSFRSRSRSRSKSKPRQLSSSDLCWYHEKFSEKANKCIQPCSYSKNQ